MQQKRTGTSIWLTVTSIVFGGAGVLLIFPISFLSIFLFDSPGSTGNPPTVLLFWSMISFPVLCLFSIVGSWVFYRFKKDNVARLVSLLPLVSGFLFLVGWFWLDVACQGNFSCYIEPPTFQEQGNATNVGKCDLPVFDSGDGLETTGCGVLEVGVTATGVIKSTSEAHNWQFFAQKDDNFEIAIEDDGKSCLGFSILDSSGKIIKALEYYHCPVGKIYWLFSPPTTGTYILRLITPESPGAYWVKIEK